MQKMKAALFAMLLCTLAVTVDVRCEGIPYSQLKLQIPDRLQLTVTTGAGETVVVDAPFIIPDSMQIPLVMVKQATFDTTDVHMRFPLPDYIDKRTALAYTSDDRAGADVLSLYAEKRKNGLNGKVDSTTRAALPQGMQPPENDTRPEEICAFITDQISLFQCDTHPDIRLHKATAYSGLHAMKRFKTPEGWTEYTIDPDKPVKNGSKGMWSLDLVQYMHGVRIFGDYYPFGSYRAPNNPDEWWSPFYFFADYMDEDHFNIHISPAKEAAILDADVMLLSYERFIDALTTRIQEGKLKSIYAVTLGYTVKLVHGDTCYDSQYNINPDARFVLVPTWEILGFDAKNAADAKSVGLQAPTRDMVLEPGLYSRYGLVYDLRMDAATGAFLLDYDALMFDPKSVQ